MKLSDIRGEKSLDIMADVMELLDIMGEDGRFQAFIAALKESKGEGGSAFRLFAKHLPPIIRDERYKKRIISVLAACADSTYEEYAENGAVLQDIVELFLSDSEALGFLASTAAATTD